MKNSKLKSNVPVKCLSEPKRLDGACVNCVKLRGRHVVRRIMMCHVWWRHVIGHGTVSG